MSLSSLLAALWRGRTLSAGRAAALDPASAVDEALRARYRAAVDALPERTRIAFLLHRAEGLDIVDVATCVGVSSEEVERLIAGALLALADVLDSDIS